jgi:hypothetical protein
MIGSRTLLAGMLAIASGAGCGHFLPVPHPLYPGPVQPSDKVAVLTGPVATVDGADVSSQGTSFALLPGCHIVALKRKIGEGNMIGAWSADLRPTVYAFRMEAGRSFEIDIHLQHSGNDSVDNATVGVAKIDAVERDARGTALRSIAPVRSDAEVEACREWSSGGDPK